MISLKKIKEVKGWDSGFSNGILFRLGKASIATFFTEAEDKKGFRDWIEEQIVLEINPDIPGRYLMRSPIVEKYHQVQLLKSGLSANILPEGK